MMNEMCDLHKSSMLFQVSLEKNRPNESRPQAMGYLFLLQCINKKILTMSKSIYCSKAAKRGFGGGISMPVKLSIAGLCIAFSFVLPGCGMSSEEMEKREAAMALGLSDTVVTDTINGVAHNFVRKADLTCKVEDVLYATRRVENLVALCGGYVTKSDLSSVINYHNSVHFKEDSLMESTFYTTSSAMVLRIPSTRLDTLLAGIIDMALFVDARNISADDVKIQLFAAKLAEKRYEDYHWQLNKNVNSGKVPAKQITAAEQALLEKQELADGKSIEFYALADQVNYSTVALQFYQAQQEKRKVVAVSPTLTPYEPTFISKLGTTIAGGFDLLKTCILFLANSWGFLFIAVLLFWLVKKIFRYSKSKAAI
jgi:hypothetical protein